MDKASVAESERDSGSRMIRAFIDAAEARMVELRGYGLTNEERVEFKLEAALYGEVPLEEIAAA